jgi:CcmD family protein
MFDNNSIGVVALIAAVIWLGIFTFMLMVSKRVKKLEAEK